MLKLEREAVRKMSLSSDKTWVNDKVGSGYQASGVVRQRKAEAVPIKILDMRGPAQIHPQPEPKTTEPDTVQRSSKKRKGEDSRGDGDSKRKKKKDKKKEKRSSKMESRGSGVIGGGGFNPILQLLASRLTAKPREFTLANSS